MPIKTSPNTIKIPRASICNTNQKTNSTLGNSAKNVQNSSISLPTKSILKSADHHQNNTIKNSVSFKEVTTKELNVLSSEISEIKNSIRELMEGKEGWQSAQKLADISHKLLDIKNKIRGFKPIIKSSSTKGLLEKLKKFNKINKLMSSEKRIEKRQNELAPMENKNFYEKEYSNNHAKSRQMHVESNERAKILKPTEHN
ncbi:hypothetical protein [Providencia vermicola]|uniref:hypothetical protein n=1 Tax=Providencia vermicola TaxID=333965 RepID=UPI00220317D9|nr:hypothetical protein NFC79_05555 [Providencia stuartii]